MSDDDVRVSGDYVLPDPPPANTLTIQSASAAFGISTGSLRALAEAAKRFSDAGHFEVIPQFPDAQPGPGPAAPITPAAAFRGALREMFGRAYYEEHDDSAFSVDGSFNWADVERLFEQHAKTVPCETCGQDRDACE